MRRLITTMAFVAATLAAPCAADACQCTPSGPPCQNFFQVQAVFAGTVRSITDASGAFSFTVHEGLSYIVSAVHNGRDARGQRPIPATAGPLVVTADPAAVRIVLPSGR